MDIYKQYINKNSDDRNTVKIGRITSAVALAIGAVVAPLLGGINQAFQFIQEYTGVVSPGILAIFLLGLFWKKTTNQAAIWGALLSIPAAMFFKVGPKGWANGTSFETIFPNIPFLDQMGYTTLITILIIMAISWLQNKGEDDSKGFILHKNTFKTSASFNISAFAILLILVFLYAKFW
jgi:SSS family solute:Na+ symporter